MTTYFKNIPEMADVDLSKRVVPKHLLPTKIDRAKLKKADIADDEAKLRAWARKVKIRDEYLDRYTGKHVKGTRAADPDRAESHHIVPRSDWAVRYDVRNGITLSFDTHDKVERNKLEIIGTRFFKVDGKRYIDATHRVIFKERP